MDLCRTYHRENALAALLACLGIGSVYGLAAAPLPAAPEEIRIIQLEGKAEISTDGGRGWVLTQTNQVLRAGYRLRTSANTRAALRWSDKSIVPIGALTELEVLPPPTTQSGLGVRLLKGILSFFHRDEPGRIRVITRGATAGIEGTEFVIAVDETGATTLSVIDGRVSFTNQEGSLSLTNGAQATATPGRAPFLTVGFVANNLLQWCFYYPAVLDPRELMLSDAEKTALAESLRAYQTGDLLQALARYPAQRLPASDSERVYKAALVLSVGQVAEAEQMLAPLLEAAGPKEPRRLALALGTLIAAVKHQKFPLEHEPELASELLAASYYAQSRAEGESSLKTALALARKATIRSPQFSFAWARVADLEFSFGRAHPALAALDTSLRLAPRNAQALALKGFLQAARNQTPEAIEDFDLALAIDSGLGNAWLGRGLCRIRSGDLKGGNEDLRVAAALEPRRSLPRSYLGKAEAEANDYPAAMKELNRAKDLDPKDPTPWLYSALLNEKENRINQAVRDLETSQELNDNRSVYRSSLLLDQDRAVRSANLAAIYHDAGMFDVSLREAARAVNYDYANYSAHLFLANSFDQLRDPNRINLRYETPAQAEYLIANLLAPANAGPLSEPVSSQEYSRLFQRDGLGLVSTTEYLSRGAWLENGAQYGTFGNSAYSLEGFYRSDPGQRLNNDFEERNLSASFKQQVTHDDLFYLQASWYEATGGDRIEYYDPSLPYPRGLNPGLRTRENEDPLLSLGYRHEWSPGMQTLVLGSRLSDRISVENPSQISLLVERTPAGLDYVEPFFISQSYRSDLEMYSGEIQQIWEQEKHTTILGARFQTGDFDTENLQVGPFGTPNAPFITPDQSTPAQNTNFVVDFQRVSFYGYHQWQIFDPLLIVGGLSYDYLKFPDNFRAAPITDKQAKADRLSPKAGLIWTPAKNTVLRAAYTRSLTGASIDQSQQLEPTQVAGFLQSFRSVLPESIGGAEAGVPVETAHASLEQKFPTGTYLGLAAELLRSKIQRDLGDFELNFSGFANRSVISEKISYQEKSLLATFNQLLGQEWSVGLRYRLSRADLWNDYPEVLPAVDGEDPGALKGFARQQHLNTILHEVRANVLFNHPCGFFAMAEALWYGQSNEGFVFQQPGDHFWQVNLMAGYRFPRRKAEITGSIL
jgi:Flp pilus assembly protein TadD